jgi:aryl sulfotransferase
MVTFMKPYLPKRHYNGVFTDTHNWDNFEHRSGDVFICVPPKSGTTWMQTICGLLIFGEPESKLAYPEISPWIDFRLSSKTIEHRLATLAAQTHQRFIKSHTPLDGIPYFEDCTYLVVHRHPLDVHFSMENHVRNMNLNTIDHLYTDDVSANFTAFLNNGLEGEGLDQPSLALIARHLKTAKMMAHLPNVHMFHYNTMSQNLHKQMEHVAQAIGVSHNDALFETLVSKATFKSMKANALLSAPGAAGGLFKDPSVFFHSGTGQKWKGKLSETEIGHYRTKISELLDSDDVDYIETGQPMV